MAANILTTRPLTVVKVFSFLTAMLYGLMLLGASVWPYMGAVIILWGIFGGINGNINQYWIAKEAPEAPDFANGLFLTAANLGCVIGTTISGWFIEAWEMQFQDYKNSGGVVDPLPTDAPQFVKDYYAYFSC